MDDKPAVVATEIKKPETKYRQPRRRKPIDAAVAITASTVGGPGSSSSAGSSLASSRVSTPSLASNPPTASVSSGSVSTSLSATSTASDSRPKYQYSHDELMKFRESPLCKNRPALLCADHEIEGIWDPDQWFGSFLATSGDSSTNVAPPKDKRKPTDADQEASVRKRPTGSGLKSALSTDDGTGDDIVLIPQRNSFNSGCQVKQRPLADSKRDSRDRKDISRIGSGRIQISERDQKADDRSGVRHSGHDEPLPSVTQIFERNSDTSRRRFDRDADDGRNRFSRDLEDRGYSATGRFVDRDDDYRGGRYNGGARSRFDHEDKSRFDREDKSRFDREDKGRFDREEKGRFDRDREEKSYDSRRKDVNLRSKQLEYTDRRDDRRDDRRGSKPSSYSSRSEAYSSSYSRNTEPEWYTEGPTSQSDTIELRGFENLRGGGRSEEPARDDRKENGTKVHVTRHDNKVVVLESSHDMDELTKDKSDHRVHFGDGKLSDVLETYAKNDEATGKDHLENGRPEPETNNGIMTQPMTDEAKQSTNQSAAAGAALNEVTNQNSWGGSGGGGSGFDFGEFFVATQSLEFEACSGTIDGSSGQTFGSKFLQWIGVPVTSSAGNITSSDSTGCRSPQDEILPGMLQQQQQSVEVKCLLDILHKPDHQIPSLPSMCLRSHLVSNDAPPAAHDKGNDLAANVMALINSVPPSSQQPVLPSGGKVLLAEDLEASLRSPARHVTPGGMVSTSTASISAAIPQNIVAVSTPASSLDAASQQPIGSSRRKPSGSSVCTVKPPSSQLHGNMQQLPVPGPNHGLVPSGQVPSLPAGARVTTLEELEAGLRGIDVASPPSRSVRATGDESAGGVGRVDTNSGGDMSAFNKLLGLVNKSSVGLTLNTDSIQSVEPLVQNSPSQQQSAVRGLIGNSTAGAESNFVNNTSSTMLFGGFDGTNCNLQDAASVQLQQRQSAATQQQKMQQKVYQQQQLLFQQQQQQQQVLSDKQLLTLIKQSPGCVGSGGGAGSGMLAGHLVASGAVLLPNSLQTQVSPHQQQQQAVHKPQHLQSYSPRGPSPVMFGSQPPLNITAPMPIHSRQRSPFGSAQLPQQPAAAVGPAAAAHPHPPSSSASLDLAYMQSLIQKQRQEQQRCQQLQHSDRSTLVQNFAPSAAVAMDNNSVSSIINVNKTTLPAFIPTSVIRQMLTAKADEKLTKEGDMVSVGGKRVPGKDVGGSDLTDADHVSGSASAIGHFNCVSTDSQHHYSSSVTTISPDSHQQPFSAAAAARRLVGQGSGPPASAVGYQPDAIQPPPQAGPLPLFGQGPLQQLQQQAPVGRPIVKGQLPYGAAASAVPSATSSHLSNQTSADQLRMHQFINQLRASSGTASQIGMMAAGGDGRMLTSAPPPTLMSPFMGPPPLQSVNQATANSALLLQHMHRAAQQQQQLTPQGFIGQQPMPSRVLRQAPLDGTTAQQPIVNVDGTSPIATGSGSVDISRWFDSRVYGHRLPNMPGQKVMTVDELECAPPTAN